VSTRARTRRQKSETFLQAVNTCGTRGPLRPDIIPPHDRAVDGEPTQLLWTGGWDSSFRLLQLVLVERRPVRPIYVIDTGRPSTLFELRAMEAIRAGLLARLPDSSPLAPIQFLMASDYPSGPHDVNDGPKLTP
jgi:hypothetical protein